MENSIYQRLARLQKHLKAPKGKNEKVAYKSRSAEQILEAVKDILLEDEIVICSDDMIFLGERYYLKAIASFVVGTETVSAIGLAREEDSRIMSPAQQTGSCSSYARKYALSGLFAIDDSKDDPDKHVYEPPEVVKDSPELETEAPGEAKAMQNDICNAIQFCYSPEEVKQVTLKFKPQLESLASNYPALYDTVMQEIDSAENGNWIGDYNRKLKLKFANVAHAEKWYDRAMKNFADIQTTKELETFKMKVTAYAEALDSSLKGPKWNIDGVTRSQNLLKMAEYKLKEMLANTP